MRSVAMTKKNTVKRVPWLSNHRATARLSHFAVLGVLSCCMYVFIWRTQCILEDYLYSQNNLLWDQLVRSRVPSPIFPPKYIMFLPITSQGTGNIINGLLSAHLMGMEFHRIVCVSTTYNGFHQAFDPVVPQAITDCPQLPQESPPNTDRVVLLNFMGIPDECDLKEKMQSNAKVIYFVGNTYPRWPKVPPGFFEWYYTPKPSFKAILPWTKPPHVVVHLRQGDDERIDPRKGLDQTTLMALGHALPSDTFLVTNKVDWYDWFATEYGWKHPDWQGVQHSVVNSYLWGTRSSHGTTSLAAMKFANMTLQDGQNLQMWSDWYTIIKAKLVWHTHSDFSLSAIHWMGTDSKTIQGTDAEGKLDLADESWRREGETEALVDRGSDSLQHCSKPIQGGPAEAGLDLPPHLQNRVQKRLDRQKAIFEKQEALTEKYANQVANH